MAIVLATAFTEYVINTTGIRLIFVALQNGKHINNRRFLPAQVKLDA